MSSQVILLVEDNPDDETLMLQALRQNGILHPVVVVRNGVEALDYLFGVGAYTGRDLSLMPQLVLLDLKLPKLNGLEVLQRIRAHQQTQLIPVVILTTSTEERDLLEGYRLQVNSFIHKPIEFAKFVEIIGHLGDYWLNVNKLPPAKVVSYCNG